MSTGQKPPSIAFGILEGHTGSSFTALVFIEGFPISISSITIKVTKAYLPDPSVELYTIMKLSAAEEIMCT